MTEEKIVEATLIPHHGNGEWWEKQRARCPKCLACVARDTLPRKCPGNSETGTKCDNYLIDPERKKIGLTKIVAS